MLCDDEGHERWLRAVANVSVKPRVGGSSVNVSGEGKKLPAQKPEHRPLGQAAWRLQTHCRKGILRTLEEGFLPKNWLLSAMWSSGGWEPGEWEKPGWPRTGCSTGSWY